MNLLSKSGLVAVLFLLPLTLHSTDISHSSEGTVQIRANLNQSIIPGDVKLGSTILVVSAPTEQEGIHIITECEHTESVLHKKPSGDMMIYVIRVTFPTACEKNTVSIGDRENTFTDASISLPILSLSQRESLLINTDTQELLSIMRKQPLPILEKTGATIAWKLEYIQSLYKNLDIALESDMARDILESRDGMKYISPVAGYALPNKDKLIPGTGRPYRRDTTDGIHHGWDIMAPFGTPVQALAKGKVIRIKSDWNWGNFGTLKRKDLTWDDELRNLDIFRGNQVWLQTMDGNVTFYSHLSKISPDIAIGTTVEEGTYLGNIGTSGVPDKNYRDIHLHFEIQQNPFREDMKNPDYLDIMRWDYMGENMGRKQVYTKMGEVFR